MKGMGQRTCIYIAYIRLVRTRCLKVPLNGWTLQSTADTRQQRASSCIWYSFWQKGVRDHTALILRDIRHESIYRNIPQDVEVIAGYVWGVRAVTIENDCGLPERWNEFRESKNLEYPHWTAYLRYMKFITNGRFRLSDHSV